MKRAIVSFALCAVFLWGCGSPEGNALKESALQIEQGNYDDAAKLLQSAFQANPNSAEIKTKLAEVNALKYRRHALEGEKRLADGDYDGAVLHFGLALEAAPDNSDILKKKEESETKKAALLDRSKKEAESKKAFESYFARELADSSDKTQLASQLFAARQKTPQNAPKSELAKLYGNEMAPLIEAFLQKSRQISYADPEVQAIHKTEILAMETAEAALRAASEHFFSGAPAKLEEAKAKQAEALNLEKRRIASLKAFASQRSSQLSQGFSFDDQLRRMEVWLQF